MLQFLPYALAALGGYKGYRGAKESGASGLGRLFGAAAVAALVTFGYLPGVLCHAVAAR